MQICGYNKTTLLDYPEHIAATVFVGNCNFRCPFCHNSGLVLGSAEQEEISEAQVLEHLQKRRGILQGVCITGGEPTLQADLIPFISRIKEMGYLVKLDTNGYRPEILEQLYRMELLDYVAMDIKASGEKYAMAAGLPTLDVAKIEESIRRLQGGKVPYEFRTTVVKGIHEMEEFDTIGKWLSGSRTYYLQAYRENENVLALREKTQKRDENTWQLSAFSREEMETMAKLAGKYIQKVEIRGMDE